MFQCNSLNSSHPLLPPTVSNKQLNQEMGRTPTQTFSRDIKMTSKQVKWCSASPIIREMQIKTTAWCYLTLVRMAIIKKSTNDRCWRECGEKGTLRHCWWECKLVQPQWETVWRFLKKLKGSLAQECTLNGYMKICLTSLIIREVLINSAMKYQLTQARMIIIKTSTNNKCWRECGEKGTLLHCWWECKLVQPLWEAVGKILNS